MTHTAIMTLKEAPKYPDELESLLGAGAKIGVTTGGVETGIAVAVAVLNLRICSYFELLGM